MQFVTEKMTCRKCRKPLEVEQPEPKLMEPEIEFVLEPEEPAWTFAEKFADRLNLLRTRKGLSQMALSKILGCPRTWISKIERGRVFPVIETLKRLAIALEVPVTDLISSQAEFDAKELLADPFIAEMFEASRGLKPKEQVVIVEAARKMWVKTKRPAMAAQRNRYEPRRKEQYAKQR